MEKGKGRFYRLQWIWNIIRNGLFMMGLRNRLEKVGLDFDPYYWELEGLEFSKAPQIKDKPELYSLQFLTYEEVASLMDSIVGMDRDMLLGGMEQGQQCIGLRYHTGAVAAFMMIETNAVTYKHRTVHLGEHEAYLLGMYTFEAFRGKNLAPFLRYKSYEFLREQGRTRLYSITAYFNKSSLKFKKKLGVRHLSLRMYIGLFKKLRWNFRIRTYSNGS